MREPSDVESAAQWQVRVGWMTALAVALYTLVLALIALRGGFLDRFMYFNTAVFLGLGYGIYRRSVLCAVVMTVYFPVDKVVTALEHRRPRDVVIGVLVAALCYQGVRGARAFARRAAPVPKQD